MIWLTKDMVDGFHRESLARFGGAEGVRDTGLLESALARAQNIFSYEPEADVFRLAAAYCTGVVKNHPFIDGNKRTGILSAIAFLSLNGIDPDFDEATIVTMVAGLAAGEISEDQLASWLREACG
ncbi:type II toxin-antitoxin system death-on-curing family toxin [soil metagenome]